MVEEKSTKHCDAQAQLQQRTQFREPRQVTGAEAILFMWDQQALKFEALRGCCSVFRTSGGEAAGPMEEGQPLRDAMTGRPGGSAGCCDIVPAENP